MKGDTSEYNFFYLDVREINKLDERVRNAMIIRHVQYDALYRTEHFAAAKSLENPNSVHGK